MSIGERIKTVRKTLGLTQQKFGERCGIKGNTIAQYELGRNEPVDAVFSLMCREFNLNEEWLRYGTGEMFRPEPLDELDLLANKYHLSNAEYHMIKEFVDLKPEIRRQIIDFIKNTALSFKENNPEPSDPADNESVLSDSQITTSDQQPDQ